MQIRHWIDLQHNDCQNKVPSTKNNPWLAVVIAGATIAIACIATTIRPSDALAGEETAQQPKSRGLDKIGLSPKMFDVDGGAGWAAGELEAYLKSEPSMAAAGSATKEDSSGPPTSVRARQSMLNTR